MGWPKRLIVGSSIYGLACTSKQSEADEDPCLYGDRDEQRLYILAPKRKPRRAKRKGAGK